MIAPCHGTRPGDETPPHDEEAERAYCGSLLLKPSKLDDPACVVEPSDLYLWRHQQIVTAVRAVHERREPVDPVTVGDELGDRLVDCGGHAYLADLLLAAPHAEHAASYAGIIREHAERRRVLLAAAEAARLARDPAASLDDLTDRLTPLLSRPRRGSRIASRRLSDYPAQSIDWLWPGRLARGKLMMLMGDPGLGKSFLVTDAAARVTSGAPWPDAPDVPQTPGSVILFSAEDDPSDTIRPRFEAAGGDPSKVVVVEGVAAAAKRGERPRHFSIGCDLAALEQLVAETGDVRLIVIDPISAYCGGMDGHKNTEVRAALAPLADLAARHRVAVVAVTHLNKAAGGKAIYRATGSLAFIAAARLGWLVAKDKDDPDRRLMVPAKANIVAEPSGLAFKIVDGVVAWEPEPLKLHGDEVLADETSDPDEVTGRDDAADFLRSYLASGRAWSQDVMREAKREHLSSKSIRSARERLCVVERDGFGPGSKVYWRLRDQPAAAIPARIDATDALSAGRGTYGIYGPDAGTYGDAEGGAKGGDEWWT